MSARPVRRGLHGKYKGDLGLNKTSKRKPCCCVPGCGETSNVVVCVVILVQYVRQHNYIV